MALIAMRCGIHFGLEIRPRWPSNEVRVEAKTLVDLQAIQSALPANITLVLTRGYEDASSRLGYARTLFRFVGAKVFSLIYPTRRNEVTQIFGSNGHDVDGTHVDISFRHFGRLARLLPFGVYTPLWWHARHSKELLSALQIVKRLIERNGFIIHPNTTESMQIHCDSVQCSQEMLI